MSWKILVVTAAMLMPAAASAQEMEAAKCTVMVAPPAELSGWSSRQKLTAAADAAGLAAATLTPGKAATLALLPTRSVHYITQPEKPGGSVAKGGLVGLAVADAGTYQVNLGSGAWIDVLKDGAAVASSAHKPGPACTGIRKTVQFPLAAGHYVIQLSGNADPALDILVSKVP